MLFEVHCRHRPAERGRSRTGRLRAVPDGAVKRGDIVSADTPSCRSVAAGWVAHAKAVGYPEARSVSADSVRREVMATIQARYSRDEFARKGQEIYDRDIRPILRPEDDDKFVAIEIESG